jgi:hypothetical protein
MNKVFIALFLSLAISACLATSVERRNRRNRVGPTVALKEGDYFLNFDGGSSGTRI